jgi:hypothetical protein
MPDILPPKRISASTGLNLIDLGDASPEQVTLVRMVLKKINASESELWKMAQELPKAKRMPRGVFDEALDQLVKSKWLWKTGSGENATYSPRLQKHISRVRMRSQMSQQRGVSSFAHMWSLLDQRAVIEAGPATEALPTRPALTSRLTGWLSGLAGTKQIVGLMVFISAASFFGTATLDVIGVSGFVETIGTKNLPWLSIAEMLLGLFTSAVYIQAADRMPRVRLMKWMLGGLAGIYLLMTLLFLASTYLPAFGSFSTRMGLETPQALLYPLVYLLRSQQVILFPVAFWNLANSLYSMTEARNVFPLLASGEMIGGLIGYALFTEFFNGAALFTGKDAPLLLSLCAAFFLFNLLITQSSLKGPPTDDEDEPEHGENLNLLESLRDGWENIREVPLFRYLAIVVMLAWVTLNLFYYHFFNGLNETGGHFESLYSFFNIVSMLLPLVLQWRIVPLLTNKVETKNAFIALPATLALGMGLSMLLPGALPIAIGLLLSTSVASSWDNPMLNTLQNLIPEERRARVSTLLSNYSYAAGQIVGSLLLLSVFTLAPVLSLANSSLYLPLGFLAALGAVFAAVMVRRTYLDSMISWRVARRQRSASVLDKLDF